MRNGSSKIQFFPNIWYPFWQRLLRPHDIKKVSNDGSGINFHYSGSHSVSVFGTFIKTSGQARSLLCIRSALYQFLMVDPVEVHLGPFERGFLKPPNLGERVSLKNHFCSFNVLKNMLHESIERNIVANSQITQLYLLINFCSSFFVNSTRVSGLLCGPALGGKWPRSRTREGALFLPPQLSTLLLTGG